MFVSDLTEALQYRKVSYRETILVHRMSDVMVTRCPSREETTLTDIVIETFQTSEAQSNDGVFLADLTF